MSIYEQVMFDIAHLHGVTIDDIKGRVNRSPMREARRGVCLLLRRLGLTYKAIGRQLGGRHHATVLNYVRPKRR